MNIPGFAAEASLYQTSGPYSFTAGILGQTTTGIGLAQLMATRDGLPGNACPHKGCGTIAQPIQLLRQVVLIPVTARPRTATNIITHVPARRPIPPRRLLRLRPPGNLPGTMLYGWPWGRRSVHLQKLSVGVYLQNNLRTTRLSLYVLCSSRSRSLHPVDYCWGGARAAGIELGLVAHILSAIGKYRADKLVGCPTQASFAWVGLFELKSSPQPKPG